MHASVALFVDHHLSHTGAEGRWCVGEGDEDHSHDFESLKFVVGHDVVSNGAFGRIGQGIGLGHGWSGPSSRELQIGGTSGAFDLQGQAGAGIRKRSCDSLGLEIQRIGEQYEFGEGADFHDAGMIADGGLFAERRLRSFRGATTAKNCYCVNGSA